MTRTSTSLRRPRRQLAGLLTLGDRRAPTAASTARTATASTASVRPRTGTAWHAACATTERPAGGDRVGLRELQTRRRRQPADRRDRAGDHQAPRHVLDLAVDEAHHADGDDGATTTDDSDGGVLTTPSPTTRRTTASLRRRRYRTSTTTSATSAVACSSRPRRPPGCAPARSVGRDRHTTRPRCLAGACAATPLPPLAGGLDEAVSVLVTAGQGASANQ